MNMNDCIKIHKENNLGFSSKLPKLILKFWYMWQTYINRSCVLITHKNASFILYDINRNEIVVMCTDKKHQGKGYGKEILKKLPNENIMVIHRKDHEQSLNFYRKSGFKEIMALANNQVLSIKNKKMKNYVKNE